MDALRTFLLEFETAVDTKDWTQVAHLQSRLQSTVEQVSQSVHTEAEHQQFADLLHKIKIEFERAESLAVEAKEATAVELRQLQKTKTAAAVYSDHL